MAWSAALLNVASILLVNVYFPAILLEGSHFSSFLAVNSSESIVVCEPIVICGIRISTTTVIETFFFSSQQRSSILFVFFVGMTAVEQRPSQP
jgi:hypothetical protein